MKPTLTILPQSYKISRLSPNQQIPFHLLDHSLMSITRSKNEISIICKSSIPIISEKSSSNWACIEIEGPLDLSLIGVLSKILNIIANEQVSILTTSTYNTDYIFVKSKELPKVKLSLLESGYTFK
ncbi:MAG TPA: ACT domain-containing protein [Chloroflexi bacterium]|nr:ACT domain-containing protein [Chloroflexota bacterium]